MTTAFEVREARYGGYLRRLAWRIRCSLIGLIAGRHVVMVNCEFDERRWVRLYLDQECCVRDCSGFKVDVLAEMRYPLTEMARL